MAALIPNGDYTITNVENPDRVLNLLGNEPFGLITAPAGGAQQWKVANFGPNGNQISLESVARPGAFATSPPNAGVDSGVSGSGAGTIWTVEPDPAGAPQVFLLRISPAVGALYLHSAGGELAVLRVPANEAAKWTFA